MIMSAGKPTNVFKAGDVIELGEAQIPVSWLLNPASGGQVTGKGVVAANPRIKFYVTHGEGEQAQTVAYTMNLYAMREPITDSEAAEIKAVAAGQKARKDAVAETAAREKKAAFDLGQSATFSALKNVGDLAAAAAALGKLAK